MGKFQPYCNFKCRKGYRFLKLNEKPVPGDEMLELSTWQWRPTTLTGKITVAEFLVTSKYPRFFNRFRRKV